MPGQWLGLRQRRLHGELPRPTATCHAWKVRKTARGANHASHGAGFIDGSTAVTRRARRQRIVSSITGGSSDARHGFSADLG